MDLLAQTAAYTYQGLMDSVWRVVNFLMRMSALAVVAVMVWYGVQMVMAGGDSGKFSDARKGFNWSLIGAAVIFGVWTIIATIKVFVASLGGN